MGVDERLKGGSSEIVDLIDAMFTRPFSRAALGLLSIILLVALMLGISQLQGQLERPVASFAGRAALLVASSVFASASCVVIVERVGPWRAIRRCLALTRGRRCFTALSLIAGVWLADGVYQGLRLAYLHTTGETIHGWPQLTIAAFAMTLVAAMGAAVIHHLRVLEERRSPAALADHFD